MCYSVFIKVIKQPMESKYKIKSGHRLIDLIDEKSFRTLKRFGIEFLRDKKTGKILRIIKHI